MRLLAASGVTKYYGADLILDTVNLSVDSGEKIGLIGANGSGKTTLIKLLLGLEEPSAGNITKSPSVRFGYVPQINSFAHGHTCRDVALESYHRATARLRTMERQMGEVPSDELTALMTRYQEALDQFDAAGGESLPNRAQSMLDALGLGGKEDQEATTLSGGEQNVLALSKALLEDPDLLVLDEPGNHLDYRGLAWLEAFLARYRGAVIIVSHNRYLLDKVVVKVVEVSGKSITMYTGNYSDYRLEKLRSLVKQQSDYVANQKRLAQLEELVKRFKEIASRTADPKWGKRLRARKTQLAREKGQAVKKPELMTRKVDIELAGEASRADIALEVNEYSKRFDEKVIFSDASLSVSTGERVALVGINGSGKTTLLRDIVSTGSWDNRVMRVGPSMNMAYCSQDQAELSGSETILDAFIRMGAENREKAYRILSRFLFTWGDLEKSTNAMSGGEKNRFQLALAVLHRANFLILDEPTNHLDIYTREAVEDSLLDFPGTVLVVSHDRYFLDKIVDRVAEIDETRIIEYPGNFSEFWAAAEHDELPKSRGKISSRARERTRESSAKSNDVERLEQRVAGLEREKVEIEAVITRAFESGDHQEGRKQSAKLDEIGRELERLYDRWALIEER